MARPKNAPHRIPHWAWEADKWYSTKPKHRRPSHRPGPKRLPLWFWPWRVWLHHAPHRKPKKPTLTTFLMFDDVNTSLLPNGAPAYAGYVNGHWPNFNEISKSHPHAKHLSIDVFGNASAMCLDIEKGDAVNSRAPGWVRERHAEGIKQPTLYTSVSNAAALLSVMRAAGFKYRTLPLLRRLNKFKLWTAHYTEVPHICSKKCYSSMPVTADATQYTDKYGGKSLDASLCSPTFI